MGASAQGAARPLQALRIGVPVGAAKSPADDGDPHRGVFAHHAIAGAELRHIPIECSIAVDFFLSGAQLCCGIHRGQWRVIEEGQGSQSGLPASCGNLERAELPDVAGAVDLDPSGVAIPTALDLGIPSCAHDLAVSFYCRLRFLMRDFECLLSRCEPCHPDRPASLVLSFSGDVLA